MKNEICMEVLQSEKNEYLQSNTTDGYIYRIRRYDYDET